jgi:hypothetical protein
MKIRIQILTLLFSSLLSLQSFAMMGENTTRHEAEIQPASHLQSDATASHDLIFSVHQKGERVLHLPGNSSLVSAESLTEEDSCRIHTSEKYYRWKAAISHERSKRTEISLTIKKRIFPFHSYL